jgi:adenosine deaminase
MNWIKLIILTLGFFSVEAQVSKPIQAKDYQAFWEQLKKKPQNLANFLNQLPKGADLHCHASGATSTENLINIAKQNHYCIDKHYVLHDAYKGKCVQGTDASIFLSTPAHNDAVLKAWSMNNFHETTKEDGKQHFFNTFGKFSVMVPEHWPEVVANVIENAKAQHIQYLELMIGMHGAKPINTTLPDMENSKTIDKFMQRSDVQKYIVRNVAYFKALKGKVKQFVSPNAQDVQVAWILEIKRNEDFAQFLLDAAVVYAIANQAPDIAGINMVQPEYAKYANHDYLKQMKWLQQLHAYFPKVKLVLHAGEVPESVAKKNKIPHIKKALQYAKPLRIGHGTTIVYEPNYEDILQYMREHQIAVEINLTSNDQILGIVKDAHPLRTYLEYDVPVVISSDDPGISRNTLSHEYFRAVEEHDISLAQLLEMDRNSVSYSLLPGKSLWIQQQTLERVEVCKDLESQSCKLFIAQSPKAYQQWRLERDLAQFFKNQFPH